MSHPQMDWDLGHLVQLWHIDVKKTSIQDLQEKHHVGVKKKMHAINCENPTKSDGWDYIPMRSLVNYSLIMCPMIFPFSIEYSTGWWFQSC